MQIDLSALGVTAESFTQGILTATGLTKEEALKQLASQLGVPIPEVGSVKVVSSGSKVQTSEGESTAQILTPSEVDTLREALAIQQRVFG